MATLSDAIRVASGKGKADLLIRNGRLVNVFSGQIERTDVAVWNGIIIGLGDYEARKVIDIEGSFLCPGLIDGHVHIESSMVTIPEFARAVVPHGTTTVVADPHEIANVLGSRGIRFMAESAGGVPLNVFFMIPSCVPATHLETSGAVLSAEEIKPLLKEPWALGLAEMMNFPGVIFGDPEVLRKLDAARGKRIDGHAPLLSGKDLNAYLAAGIRSDHETTTLKEAKEKLSKGMWIMAREGSTARNLRALLPLATPENSRRFLLVTDDRHPRELIGEGHIDSMVQKAIQWGTDPILAIQMATLNPADYFRLDGLGAIAPGYRADIVVFDHLSRFQIKKVFKDGRLVAEDGKMLLPRFSGAASLSGRLQGKKSTGTVRIRPVSEEALVIRGQGSRAKVIQLIPDQIITKKVVRTIPVNNGIAHPNVKEDILKIVVIERHRATGRMGIGFVQGFGLKSGAIGSTVAHDSHNLIAVGTNDPDILKVIHEIESMGGGIAVASGGKALASLPLPIAGLMAQTSVERVDSRLEKLHRAVKGLGCRVRDPFMTLSFLALPVIPELKLTDKGLVDVNRFKIVPLFGED